jgi:prepilin-type N-terminal cleavage/methylation domain-containing protein
MKSIKKKGFTLIELLAVIVVLGIILVIAIPNVIKIVEEIRIKAFLRDEEMLERITRTYILDNIDSAPVQIGEKVRVELSDLQSDNYVDEIINPNNQSETCTGYVEVERVSNDSYTYNGCIRCGDDYVTEGYTEPGISSWTLFAKFLDGNSNDFFRDITKTNDGGYVAVGASSSTSGYFTGLNQGFDDAIIVKYDTSNNIVWNKNFGGSNFELYNEIVSVADGVVAAGYSGSTTGDMTGLSKGSDDAIIVKYDVSGNVVWKKSFGGSKTDYFTSLISQTDGFVAVGYSRSSDVDLASLNKGAADGIIVKYDLNGNVVWKKTFGGTGDDFYYKCDLQLDGISDGIIVVGSTKSSNGDLTGLSFKGMRDAIIVKYDLSGNVVWKKNFGGNYFDDFYSVIKITNGYMAVGGSGSTSDDLLSLNKGSDDAIMVKYDVDGNVVWKKAFGGSKSEWFNDIAAITDGYIAVGQGSSTDVDLAELNKGYTDAIMVKYDLSGNVVWKKDIGGTQDENFYSIAAIENACLIVGESYSGDGDYTESLHNTADLNKFGVFLAIPN